MGPSAGSVLQGSYQDEGVEEATGARVSRVVKKAGERVKVSACHLCLSFYPFNQLQLRSYVGKKIFTPVTPLPPPPGRLVLPEELPHGEGLVRGVGVTQEHSVGHMLKGGATFFRPPSASAHAQ